MSQKGTQEIRFDIEDNGAGVIPEILSLVSKEVRFSARISAVHALKELCVASKDIQVGTYCGHSVVSNNDLTYSSPGKVCFLTVGVVP